MGVFWRVVFERVFEFRSVLAPVFFEHLFGWMRAPGRSGIFQESLRNLSGISQESLRNLSGKVFHRPPELSTDLSTTQAILRKLSGNSQAPHRLIFCAQAGASASASANSQMCASEREFPNALANQRARIPKLPKRAHTQTCATPARIPKLIETSAKPKHRERLRIHQREFPKHLIRKRPRARIPGA